MTTGTQLPRIDQAPETSAHDVRSPRAVPAPQGREGTPERLRFGWPVFLSGGLAIGVGVLLALSPAAPMAFMPVLAGAFHILFNLTRVHEARVAGHSFEFRSALATRSFRASEFTLLDFVRNVGSEGGVTEFLKIHAGDRTLHVPRSGDVYALIQEIQVERPHLATAGGWSID